MASECSAEAQLSWKTKQKKQKHPKLDKIYPCDQHCFETSATHSLTFLLLKNLVNANDTFLDKPNTDSVFLSYEKELYLENNIVSFHSFNTATNLR